MRQHREILAGVAMTVAAMLSSACPANALPATEQVLSDLGMSDSDKQRVLAGEFVTSDLPAVSPRDLSISIAFLVKASPDALAKEIAAGDLLRDDPQLKQNGVFHGTGSFADLANLKIDAASAKKWSSAEAGETLNLSTAEIAALNALQGAAVDAVQGQVRQMLLARYKSYQSSGLAGIAAYDRGGQTTDTADDLRKASESAAGLKKYLPMFQKVLVGYPQATVPGMSDTTRWIKYDIDGTETIVLSQTLLTSDGDARAVVQRQFYVSTGYNGEQAVAGLLPVEGGTVVVYSNHTFTDQVEGFGGSTKRSIGRRMMESKLQAIFDRERKQVAQ